MLKQLKSLENTYLIEVGIVIVILLPIIFIAYFGFENIMIHESNPSVISYVRLIFRIMILLSTVLI
jgi:hypothetical protein